MKKYTSKSQKVDLYSQKYNLTREEVNRILSEHEDVLTLDELKIKYDCLTIGQLPEWLTEDELDKMIWKTVHDRWSLTLAMNGNKEELYMDLQVYIRKKMHLYENHNHIKGALYKRILFIVDELTRHGKYYLGSLDEPAFADSDDSNAVRYRYEPAVDETTTVEDNIFLNQIRSIKDSSVRNLLIITGYLVCEIDELRKDYIELLRNYDPEIKANILKLESMMLNNDKIEQARVEGVKNNKRKQIINVKDIIKALKLNVLEHKTENANTTLKEIKYYLQACGIV